MQNNSSAEHFVGTTNAQKTLYNISRGGAQVPPLAHACGRLCTALPENNDASEALRNAQMAARYFELGQTQWPITLQHV